MTLSYLVLILIPLFLIPAIFLPDNRLKSFTLCSIIPFLTVGALFAFNIRFPNIEYKIGTFNLPAVSFLLKGYTELTDGEILHLSFFFALLVLYLGLYLISYLIVKFFFIGSNPNIHKPIKVIFHIFYVIVFFVFTYGSLGFFLIEIRQIIPLEDGFLAQFFNWVYLVEA